MANVAKLKKKAAEFELKRQFDKALAIYIELLDDFDSNPDEVDVALFNRVGDMLLRQGNVADAVDYYERAVDRYAEGGFFNNAIALCNKILRQSPGRASIYYKLGKISAQKGFINDAKQNFLEYADRMQKSGRMDEAFRALKEFADLCPDQDDIRLMLADQLSKQMRGGEAIEQLQTLFDQYSASGRDGEARATLDRIKAIEPGYEPRATGPQKTQSSSDLVFLDVYSVGDKKTPPKPEAERPVVRAAEPPVAPPPPAADPLAAAMIDLGTPVAEPMSGLESTSYPPPASPADDGMLDLEPTSFGSDEMDPFASPASNSMRLDGLESTSFDAPAPVEPADDTSSPDLEFFLPDTQADQVSVPASDFNFDFGIDLGIEPGTEASVQELSIDDALGGLPLMDMEVSSTPVFGDGQDGGVSIDLDLIPSGGEETATVIPTSFEPADEEEEDSAAAEAQLERRVVEQSDRTRRSTIAAEQSVELLAALVEADADDLPLRRRLAEARLESGDREGGLADLEAAMVGHERMEDLAAAASVADEIARIVPDSVSIHQKRVEYAFRTNERPRLVAAYLDLAAALLGDGQSDKARTVYKRVLDLAPDDIAAQSGLAALTAEEPVAPEVRAPAAAPPPVPAPAPAPAPAPVAAARPTYTPAKRPPLGGRKEPSALKQPPAGPVNDLHDEPRTAPAVSLPAPQPVSQPALPTAAPAAAGDASFINLGDWLREDQGPKNTRMVVEEQEPTGDEEADFADMLRRFKQGVAENVDEEDHQAHYDLGVAFKEMGLIDEAISEFQRALRAPTNRLPTYEALGQCFVEKGQYQVARAILARALSEAGVSDDQLIGVLYLLGHASESLGLHKEALAYYQRVFVVDIQFRDVADRLTAVEQAAR